jgi:hypothetical protein
MGRPGAGAASRRCLAGQHRSGGRRRQRQRPGRWVPAAVRAAAEATTEPMPAVLGDIAGQCQLDIHHWCCLQSTSVAPAASAYSRGAAGLIGVPRTWRSSPPAAPSSRGACGQPPIPAGRQASAGSDGGSSRHGSQAVRWRRAFRVSSTRGGTDCSGQTLAGLPDLPSMGSEPWWRACRGRKPGSAAGPRQTAMNWLPMCPPPNWWFKECRQLP